METWKLIIIYLIILILVFGSFIIINPFTGHFPDAVTISAGVN